MQLEMNAVVMDRFGPSSVLEYRKVPVEAPGDDEVLIEVHAVSINRTLDLNVRTNGDGRSVTLPHILGVDPSGIVVEIGSAVESIHPGDRVAVTATRCGQCASCQNADRCERQFHPGVERWGGYAEYITVPAWTLLALPETMGFAEATVLFRHYPTAHHLLAVVGKVSPGERVLVLGSAGGLGSAAVEVADRLGAEVIAGAGAVERVQAGVSRGALWGVNYRSEDLADRVMEFTNGKGVDVLVENIGEPKLWSEAFSCVGRDGRVVTAGAHGGGTVTLDLRRLYQNRISIFGSSGRTDRDVDWVLREDGVRAFRPLIGAVMPLSEARRAHDLVEANAITGKIILDPRAHL
ncbi:MAG TPA: zinc-binding dehydrogenase [Acidimicrobiales bacterium]|nr:zinc-binding dehydrogenase [Acidimicrobiales bacterium]